MEREVLPACEHFGLGFLPFFPLAPRPAHRQVQARRDAARGHAASPWGRASPSATDTNFDKVEALT